MAAEKQTRLGGELFGTPMDTVDPGEAPTEESPDTPDLDTIQTDSEKQPLPEQDKVFRVAKRVRSRLHNLPDPTRPPLGMVPGRGYDVVFPFIKLPHLAPNLNGDWVQFGSPDLAPNRLYYGDNLQVLRTLKTKSIDLIYIDPPFFSGEEYNVIWGDTNEVRTFSDIWEGGIDTYLIWLNARLWEMRRVLKDTGSIYVHCDSHASHYIKHELDNIFGYKQFRNEIIWRRTGSNSASKRFGPLHQTLFYYVKSDAAPFYPVIAPYTTQYVDEFFGEQDDRGQYQAVALTGPGTRTGQSGERWRDYDPTDAGRHWQPASYVYEKYRELTDDDLAQYPLLERLDKMDAVGLIHWAKKEGGGVPRYKYYLDDAPGVMLQDIWGYQPGTAGCVFERPKDGIDQDVRWLSTKHPERLGYPTQKPEGLLQRIILASSQPGQVVADFFCGGGVTAAVAQRLGRRWIACDSSRVAISVTLNRLVALCEEQSGVMSNYSKAGQVQQRMDLPTPEDAVPDIRVHYVGVYPMDRFKAVGQGDFEKFILACLAAQADNSDSAISGWRSPREPLRVGPADPDVAPDAKDVQAFFQAVIHKLQPDVRTVARYVCWRGSPELTSYRRRLTDYIRRNIQPRGADLDFDFLHIDSEEFRDRIRQKYPDADDNEFLLRFTKEPVIGEIATARLGPRKYRFEARDAGSTNTGGYLVNCQWDFDFQRGHFAADSKYVLGRKELKGEEAKAAGHKFEAVLTAEHTFASKGTHTVACRIQDNLGAEAVRTISIEVS